MPNAKIILKDQINFVTNTYEALDNQDALVIVTEWNEFKHANFNKIKSQLKKPTIFDGRNLYNPSELKKLGFQYFSVGRKPIL